MDRWTEIWTGPWTEICMETDRWTEIWTAKVGGQRTGGPVVEVQGFTVNLERLIKKTWTDRWAKIWAERWNGRFGRAEI